MTNSLHLKTTFGPQSSAAAAQALHDDIRDKWDRLSDFEVGHLTSADDLVTQVVRLYSLDRTAAQREVVALLHGRAI